jgi:hypothetical protein
MKGNEKEKLWENRHRMNMIGANWI